jgi:GT2 family glycosyltransferase
VEANASWPKQFQRTPAEDGSAHVAAYLERVLRRWGLPDGRWAYHALHTDNRVYGLAERELRRLYRDAALILNLHAGTTPLPEHSEPGRLVLVDTDPVGLQVDVYNGDKEVVEFLELHSALFTWGENFYRPDCGVPMDERFLFRPTRMPLLLERWRSDAGPGETFTTIGNWEQWHSERTLDGELYTWSKHHEFLKFLELPKLTEQRFELALSSADEGVQAMLRDRGWKVREGLSVSRDTDSYRDYIAGSRGEFTVAKDQNVRLRSGWFSDRSASYLACSRPVVTQDTGFGSALPTGEGLFAFSTAEDVVAAVDEINRDYERHSRAARDIAYAYFDSDRVLGLMLAEVGLSPRADSVIVPISRRPTRLHPTTEAQALAGPPPAAAAGKPARASIVVVTHDGAAFTDLCVRSVVENTDAGYELIVVDNASTDATRDYLTGLAEHNEHVRAVFNDTNRGFGAATNQGLELADGDILVLLNNDTIVPPGWLRRMACHLGDPTIGLVGASTNRIGNEAQLNLSYRTYAEFLVAAGRRARERRTFPIGTATMFCVAMRRDAHELIGPLDERFEVGLLEDDDYSLRTREAGLQVVCAEDVLVHHFGEASFGTLVPSGEYMQVLRKNQALFEEKWGRPPETYGRRSDPSYEALKARVQTIVDGCVPAGETVLVVSRGDDELVTFAGRRGWHFPATEGRQWAGSYPADGEEAVAEVEGLRQAGASFMLVPKPGFWWLEHYEALASYLERSARVVARDDDTCVIYRLGGKNGA